MRQSPSTMQGLGCNSHDAMVTMYSKESQYRVRPALGHRYSTRRALMLCICDRPGPKSTLRLMFCVGKNICMYLQPCRGPLEVRDKLLRTAGNVMYLVHM